MLKLSPEMFASVTQSRKRQLLASAEAEEAGAVMRASILRAMASVDASADTHVACLMCGCVVPRPAQGAPAACECNGAK